MDMYMRRKCQQCRLRKCREAGMLEQCALRGTNQAKKMKKQQEEETARTSTVVTHSTTGNSHTGSTAAGDERSWWPCRSNATRDLSLTDQNNHVGPEIVDFAKQLPGFLELTREDQIALLKTSTIEIMLLETSRRYNPAIDSITF
ncbi:hypothetical protein INR49_020014 [Caranx melampygus]|nr:hypothetical protein INR49_020014 [Caranx melampygus]